MIGRTLAHYKITAAIGAGGMGEVYRATDTKLGRDVALKVLPADMASSPDRLERFRREAKALAALDHTGIVTVHSVEEADGVHFLTMQLVEGQPLHQLIPDSGLDVQRLLEIASGLAEALAAAHDKGIVHRDLKPANVMLTKDGRVKVLDFGLAKIAGPVDGAAADSNLSTNMQTREGVVMGTMPYMSPEQVQGRPLDHRTDIFSLGVILYEMATGRRPFQGHSAAELASAILRDTPRPLGELRTDMPEGLVRVIQRCLEKEARDRIQTTRDVSNEFRTLRQTLDLGTAPPAGAGSAAAAKPLVTPRKRRHVAAALIVLVLGAVGFGVYLRGRTTTVAIDSIVVLPFENRSNDPEADYISDGITESISNSLTWLPDLKVIPTSVAFHYKGKAMTTQAVGDELRVAAVLTGRVTQRGDDLTIGVELDDVRQGKQLWGTRYNRKLADLLSVQRDIATEVSQRLRSQLAEEDQRKLMTGSTDNPAAYQLYLKGNFYTSKFTKDGARKGVDYFNQAIALDPNYALAYDGLAFNYSISGDWFMPPKQAAPLAREAARKALAIDGALASAHMSLAIVSHWYDWDWATSEREFTQAIALKPNDPRPRDFYAWLLANLGRHDEAIGEARRAQQLDPVSVETNLFLGQVLVWARRYDQAIEALRAAVDLEPNYWYAHEFLGKAFEQTGRLPEAIAAFEKALELEKDNSENWGNLAHAYAVSGKRGEALKLLATLKETSAQSYVAPYNVAIIYAGLGNKDQAFAWLDRACDERSGFLAFYLSNDARWDPLRSDPRFGDLVRRIGLPSSRQP